MPHTRRRLAAALLLGLALAACGQQGGAQVEPPTPTPLPPDPALERPTYTARRGPIERALEVTARATPVDSVRLAFRRDGRVNKVLVQRGDTVKAGDVLAELQQEEALDDLRQAKDDLTQAQRDLDDAGAAREKGIKERELAVEQARTDLARLLPGGDADVLREAEQKLEDAQREARRSADDRSWAKTAAEDALRSRAEALQDSQKAYSKAKWDLDWVEKYGTHPTERVASPSDPERLIPRKLTDEEKEKFREAVVTAERALRAAERSLEEATRALDKAREDESVENGKSAQKVAEAQRAVDQLRGGKDTKEVADARRALDQAQLALAEARAKTLNAESRALDTARRALDRAQRKVDDGRVIATQDGQVLSISAEEGANATAFEPVVELADPTRLEFAATLTGEQMRQLAEGQPAELRLLTRPDLALAAVIRRMPAPYGSGGSGSVQDRDQTTRFEVADTQGQQLRPGASLAKVRIVIERKEGVLLLPPEAVRAFEGRRFVIVREGDRERRVPVKLGIATEQAVEITDGLEEGAVVVGP